MDDVVDQVHEGREYDDQPNGPRKLNRKWAKAARFADMFAGMAAMLAVIVVPGFLQIIAQRSGSQSNLLRP